MPKLLSSKKPVRHSQRRRLLPKYRGDLHRLQPRTLQPRSLQLETLEARLTMSAAPHAAANPLATWFDSHVSTLSIRNLGKTDIQDGVLSRSDMMAIFSAVEKVGAVTATEFSDLKNIVNYAGLFTGVGYVEVLSQDVVIGNTANAHYQGKALGNLKAGSTVANLTNLVNKWFLGADHPVGKSDWGPTYSYRKVSGQLFVNGASYTDVQQGGLGDCYFLSALAETALKNPGAITSMFIINGDGTYTVRFMHGSKAEYVTVDSQLPTDSSGHLVFDGMGHSATSSSNELWVALAEKAYVEINECGWIRPASWGGGQNVYTGISGGAMYMALNQITGAATVAYTSTTSSFDAMAAAFNAGKSICFGSKDSPANTNLVVGDHAYAVVAVNTTTHTVTLFNPWGLNNGHDSGTVTLSWTQVQANFDWYDRTA
ncbi:MAG TPA: C2 family cysteine protease [Pirellulales bacterium]